MTNEEMFQDIKHLVQESLDSQTKYLDGKIDKLGNRVDGLENRMGRLENQMGDMNAKLDTVIDTFGEEIVEIKTVQKRHEKRIIKLETKAA